MIMIKERIYYGWLVLAALFIIYSITNGVILNTLPLFYPNLVEEFGWTQDQVTRPAQLLFLIVAVISPVAGLYVDRISIKRMMITGGVLLLCGFVLFNQVQSLPSLLAVYIVFSIGITLAGIIPSMKIVTNWFYKNRGVAVGILLVGSSIGGAIFNPLAGLLIQDMGWRFALLVLGVLAFALIFIPLMFVVRENPRGVKKLERQYQEEFSGMVEAFTEGGLPIDYGRLFTSKVFYLMLFVTGAMWFCIVGIIQHQALFIKDLNTSVNSSILLSLFFVFSVLGKVIFGKLSDKYAKRSIMFLAVCNLAVGSLVLSVVKWNPDVLLWVYAVVFGIGFSGTFTMIQLLIAEYYQGASYGKVLGVFTMIDTIAGVLGIMILGKMRTAFGDYDYSFWLMLGLSIISAIVVLSIPRKQTSK